MVYITPIICNMIVWTIFVGVILSYAYYLLLKRRKVRARILRTTMGISEFDRVPEYFIPIRYCGEERFGRFWKFFPWDGAGWLINKRSEIIFLSEHTNDVFEKQFKRNKIDIQWVGRSWWKAGGLSWIKITSEGRKYYFTSETGLFIFGSEAQTIVIYDTITNPPRR